MHVVFHINEEERWDMVLSNVNNFLAEEGDAKISIVANGHAVNYYLNDELSDMILNQLDVVASGVVEIAKKQIEGYAYIRP